MLSARTLPAYHIFYGWKCIIQVVKINEIINRKLEINEIQPVSVCTEETKVDTTNKTRILIFNLVIILRRNRFTISFDENVWEIYFNNLILNLYKLKPDNANHFFLFYQHLNHIDLANNLKHI